MEKLIRPQALADKLGIGLSTLYDRMKEPDFPAKSKFQKMLLDSVSPKSWNG